MSSTKHTGGGLEIRVVDLPAQPAALRRALRDALADRGVEALALTRNVDLGGLPSDAHTDPEQLIGQLATQLGAPRGPSMRELVAAVAALLREWNQRLDRMRES